MAHAFGIKQVNTKFTRMGVAAVNAEPALQTVADVMMRIFIQVFESQGRRGGGSWKRDSDDWLIRKQRMGLDPRIGHATHALRNAFGIRKADHQILDVTHKSIHLTTDLPYAATEQEHRPFVKFTQRDKLEMRSVVRNYLIENFRA